MSTSMDAQLSPGEEEIRPDDRDLVKILTEDTTGQEQQNLKNTISAARTQAQNELNAGVGSDEFKALTEFVKAANAAEEIVEAFWTEIHVKQR